MGTGGRVAFGGPSGARNVGRAALGTSRLSAASFHLGPDYPSPRSRLLALLQYVHVWPHGVLRACKVIRG